VPVVGEVEAFGDVPLHIEVELGRPLMKVRDILKLEVGSVIELKRAAGENIDIRVGGAMLGWGEIVVADNSVGVRITDLRSVS
jgi:flagellar motor switch protein FliN/FliY